MKKSIKIILAILIIVIVTFVLYRCINPRPCFNQNFVEQYVSKYSNNFTLLKNESYSVGLEGFKESNDTDWYFHDNELDFDFHVKTLKSEYPPKGKHIICNYYDKYIEKLIEIRGLEIKNMIAETFAEIYDVESCNIYFFHDSAQIRIDINGEENINFSKEKDRDLCEIVSKKLLEFIKGYDSNFKNRCMKIGWDIDLNTDWSKTDKDFSIRIDGNIFKIEDYL